MGLTDQINSHYGLFLNHLIQSDESFVLFLSEARVNRDKVRELKFNEGTEFEMSLSGRSIETDAFCKKYKVTFDSIVAYQSVDESYISWSDEEIFNGKLLKEFFRSRFLDHASDHLSLDHYEDMTGQKYKHFQFSCLNFVVDILAPGEPFIEEVEYTGFE